MKRILLALLVLCLFWSVVINFSQWGTHSAMVEALNKQDRSHDDQFDEIQRLKDEVASWKSAAKLWEQRYDFRTREFVKFRIKVGKPPMEEPEPPFEDKP